MKCASIPQFCKAWCYVESEDTPAPQWVIDALMSGEIAVEKEFAGNKMIKILTLSGNKEPLNGVYEIVEGKFDYVVQLHNLEIVLMKSREFHTFFKPVLGE